MLHVYGYKRERELKLKDTTASQCLEHRSVHSILRRAKEAITREKEMLQIESKNLLVGAAARPRVANKESEQEQVPDSFVLPGLGVGELINKVSKGKILRQTQRTHRGPRRA